MKLNQISDNSGARKVRNRVGRGMATGNGKTSGRGHKGLGQRSGGKVRAGFEGGQNPLYLRLPMRGFNNANFRTVYNTINVGELQQLVDEKKLSASKTIDLAALQAIGLFKKAKAGLKILGSGEVTSKLTIDAVTASKSAIALVEKAGGKLTVAPKKESQTGVKLVSKGKEKTMSRLEKKNAAKKAS